MPHKHQSDLEVLNRDAQYQYCRLIDALELGEEPAVDRWIDTLADTLLRRARAAGRPYPLKSVASWLRQHADPDELVGEELLVDRIRSGAATKIGRVASALPREARAFDEADMADHLGITLAEVRKFLLTEEGRRGLGFPMHVGQARFRWTTEHRERAANGACRDWLEPVHPVPLPPEFAPERSK